jgi:hypothetical protein
MCQVFFSVLSFNNYLEKLRPYKNAPYMSVVDWF